jgi:hypothetical protein
MERTWAAGLSGREVGVAGHDGLDVELGELEIAIDEGLRRLALQI